MNNPPPTTIYDPAAIQVSLITDAAHCPSSRRLSNQILGISLRTCHNCNLVSIFKSKTLHRFDNDEYQFCHHCGHQYKSRIPGFQRGRYFYRMWRCWACGLFERLDEVALEHPDSLVCEDYACRYPMFDGTETAIWSKTNYPHDYTRSSAPESWVGKGAVDFEDIELELKRQNWRVMKKMKNPLLKCDGCGKKYKGSIGLARHRRTCEEVDFE